ncbi:MAG: hypothetical protein V2A72_02455 [Candidatus Omnitrophota bacterium]
MLRNFLVVLLICVSSLILAGASMAQDEEVAAQEAVTQEAAAQEVVKGTIGEIAADSSYIMVDATKILTTPEFLEDSYLEVGDKVEVIVTKTEQGLSAVDYDYIYDDEETEEDMGAMEDMTEDAQEGTIEKTEDDLE